ncbi:hypothetical protein K458DRAFT_413057 [Lentithecium fluviatile CBS 122367]|uniref:PHD-type domain-containing protein n=1 Tax=Lentithecium fluviatile CBS 122367 TaxID=1168545 RepID=A0A6G1JI60_9PLEO|nr:hypothetical protein K458DRAFT_413057 [Lentithecium fluviatile CBS 122367]
MPPAAGSRTVGTGTASDRRQSTRQGRTTVRNYYARNFAGRLAANGMEQTPEVSNAGGFCPALTHFTQAVDAFPKELIKHFSMFKEVEAKMHDPEHELRLLLDGIAQMPVPTKAQRHDVMQNGAGPAYSAAATVNGAVKQDHAAQYQQLFPDDFNSLPPDEQADLKKRQAFFNLRTLIYTMIPTLDEKLVVLGGAIATKDRGLARMNGSYSHLDEEISEEARYGSLTHWAYADKEEKKKGGASHERQRREVVSANNLAAAAQHVHDVDSIAAKSEARREAMLANKRNRHQHNDSDFDDRPAKKPQKRKAVAADAAAGETRNIGLGIISNGGPPQGKRKKTEKALAAAAAAPPMERSLSGALRAAGTGGRSGTSPRATPGAEGSGTGKRKPRAAPVPALRKHPLPHYSPPLPSSPLTSNFPPPKATALTADRPASIRARNNSIAHSVASTAPEPAVVRRPSSSHSVQQAASSNAITELEQAAGINRENATKDASPPKDTTELPPFEALTTSTLKHEDPEPQEPVRMEIDIPAPAPVTTRAGRTSKTATPIVGSFADIPMARSRSTRKAGNGNSNSNASSENNSTATGIVSKRAPKKAVQPNSTVPQSPAMPPADAKSNHQSSRASSIAPEQDSQDADSEEDGDEPRYCYCNQVSYGNMIACDNDTCAREWFHLPCVNLDRAPSGRKKWFCSDECKDAYAEGKTAKGGRPGSSRQ